jgi:hypothetical protein
MRALLVAGTMLCILGSAYAEPRIGDPVESGQRLLCPTVAEMSEFLFDFYEETDVVDAPKQCKQRSFEGTVSGVRLHQLFFLSGKTTVRYYILEVTLTNEPRSVAYTYFEDSRIDWWL